MSKLSSLDTALNDVLEAGDGLGIDEELSTFATGVYDGLYEDMNDWAGTCEEKWAKNAPWATENLRNSIASEVDWDNLEAWVGVDVDRLLQPAGSWLPFKRRKYYWKVNGEGRSHLGQKMPYKDYTLIANQNAVSAGGKNPRPGSGTPTPFIEQIWHVIANQEKERIFGYGG